MEARKLILVSITLCTLLLHRVCHAADADLTVEINAGATECFWQRLALNAIVELEYQVIGGGDLDIDFTLYSPSGQLLESESRETESSVKVPVTMEGEYKFCFDNSFSRMSSKVVFFELVGGEEEDDDDDWKFDMEEVKDMVDMTLDDIKGVIDRSRGYLDKSIQLQNLLKMHEARDRNVVEANFSRINIFSAFQVFVMITVSLTQVLMIRSLFQDKRMERDGLRQKT